MMDQNLLERVNPVFNTAKMTVFQLAAAGVEDAARVAEKLNLTPGRLLRLNPTLAPSDFGEGRQICVSET